MDALLPVLVGVAVLAVVIGVTRHALGARLHADGKEASKARQLAYDITVGAAGLLIVLVSVVTGRSLLTVEEPPGGELYKTGVGVAPDDRAKPDPRHGGFLVGMATQFTSCDEPVAVTLGVVGSAEYYERRRAELRRPTTIRLALPSNGLRRAIAVDYGGRGYEDALKPPLARPAARPVGSPIVGRPVEHPDAEITSIGVTIDGWSSHLQSLVVRFEANWLRKRGLGTCYLALPPLVGEYTVLAAQAARNRTTREADGLVQVHPQLGDPLANNSSTVYAWYDRSLLVRNGISVVGAGRGDIVKSEPAANTVAAGFPGIACSQPSLTTGGLGAPEADLVRDDYAYAIREHVFASQVGGLDCSAIVTLAEADAGRKRDLVLILVGTFVSLGVAVLLELALDRHRRSSQRAVA